MQLSFVRNLFTIDEVRLTIDEWFLTKVLFVFLC